MSFQKSKIIFFSLLIVLSFLMAAQVVLAEKETGADTGANTGANKALEGLNTTGNTGYGVTDVTKTPTLSETIGKVVGAVLSFLGVAFFILMIYGGYMWMFSMGNEQTATKAKDILIAAVVGLVIVLLAYVLTVFIGRLIDPTQNLST